MRCESELLPDARGWYEPFMSTRRAPVLIKKYANRRLYDTSQSRYITLDDLASKIQSGTDVRVVDVESQEDLTQSTLAQIIVESRGAARLLPVHLMTQLIRMGDDALAEFFGRYISWSLELYLGARASAQAMTPLNPFATLPFSATSAMARFFSNERSDPPVPEPAGEAPPPPDAAPQQIAELRKEIEALKEALKGRFPDE